VGNCRPWNVAPERRKWIEITALTSDSNPKHRKQCNIKCSGIQCQVRKSGATGINPPWRLPFGLGGHADESRAASPPQSQQK